MTYENGIVYSTCYLILINYTLLSKRIIFNKQVSTSLIVVKSYNGTKDTNINTLI